MGSAASTTVHLARRSRKTNALVLRYGDAKGELQKKFKTMKISPEMRLSWLERWQLMDADGSKLLDYSEFLEACGLPDNMWSWRMFNLLDKNFVGCVDFVTFFSSVPRFLVYDRTNAIEVAFRMCSRRGATWDPDRSVLDEKDIRLFVEERYPSLDRKHTLHRALGILAHLDDDCSGGVSFKEFQQFCDMNLIFLTAVQETLQSMRNALFGEDFWKEFTRTARTFDKPTTGEIFCMSQADTEDDDPNTGGFADAATRKFAAATKRQLGALASAAVNKKRQKVDDMSSFAHTTGEKLRRVVSESNLGRGMKATDTGAPVALSAGGVMVEKLKLWTTTAPSNTASKSRSLTARAGEAKATLRRVVSDSDLRSFGRSETSRLLKPPAPKLNEGLVGAPADLTHSVSQPEVSSAAGKAEQQETEKLEDTARDTSQSGSAIRMVSARKVLETRELLSGEARKLTAAAGRLRTFGRLKATAMASVAIRRMRVLAEAARQERTQGASSLSSLSKDPLGRLLSALPRQLPDAETTRNKGKQVGNAAKVGGARALAALKRSVRVITAARYFSETILAKGGSRRGEQQATGGGYMGARNSEEDTGQGLDIDTESEGEEGEGEIEKAKATAKDRGVLTGAQAKMDEAKLFEGRHWAATEKFYARLATATERLEAKKTPEKGYDFSADFPKLWCAAQAHGSQRRKEVQHRRKRRSSTAKQVANVYLRFIALWQEAGDDSGRSKLSTAFDRWRLNTCDATVDDLSGSISTLSRGGTLATGRGEGQFDFSIDAPSRPPRRVLSLQEMWETAAAAAGQCGGDKCDLHKIIMNQSRADRPLPWELCETYEREMVERIDRRQQDNNVPLLPMHFY